HGGHRGPAGCPGNRFSRQGHEARLAARDELAAPALAELAGLDDRRFREKFARSPIKRTGRDRFVRNVLIAIGNSNDLALAPPAEALLGDLSSVVRGAAIWALHRLAPQRLAAHAGERERESDVSVQHEWSCALGEPVV